MEVDPGREETLPETPMPHRKRGRVVGGRQPQSGRGRSHVRKRGSQRSPTTVIANQERYGEP